MVILCWSDVIKQPIKITKPENGYFAASNNCPACNDMRLTKIILAFWGVLGCMAAVAQQDEVNFTSLTTKDGLSSNTVNAILKDRYGLVCHRRRIE